jgi:phosphoglycerate dehydrogenase-like enzyme
MLVILRRVFEMTTRIRSGERVPSIYALAPGLQGKTVGFVGMGDIAYELCKLLTPFGCRILVFSPTSPVSRWTEADSRYPQVIPHERIASLEELLPEVDVLSIHCPLTPSTNNLISEREIGLMKDSAVVINTARGGIIDELALAKALKEGRLAGAGLDVVATEPAYGANLGELGKMLNVVILPHLYVEQLYHAQA